MNKYIQPFLAHLSWKLKWAFLITCRPSSVCPSVRLYVGPSFCLCVCILFLTFIFSRTTGPISTKLGEKYPWVKGIQVCSNYRPYNSQRGDNWEILNINWQLLKGFFSRTTRPHSTKFSTKYPWVNEIQVCSNDWSRLPFPREDNYEKAKIH